VPRPTDPARLLLPGEDPAAFDALRAELLDHWQPPDPLTRQLVERAALLLWRLHRLAEAEHELLMEHRMSGERRYRGGTAMLRALTEDPSFVRFSRYEQQVAHELADLTKRLAELCGGPDRRRESKSA